MAQKAPSFIQAVTADLKTALLRGRGQPEIQFRGRPYTAGHLRHVLARLEARAEWCECCAEKHPEPHMNICADCEDADRRRHDPDDHDHAYDSWRDEQLSGRSLDLLGVLRGGR